MNKIILNVNEKQTVDNYPYGAGKETRAYLSVEFSSKKGFRYVYQTVNPIKNRLNEPNKGTYNECVYLYKNDETGLVERHISHISGYDNALEHCEFFAANFEALGLTSEMCIYLYGRIKKVMETSLRYMQGDQDALAALFKPCFELLETGIKTGENIFGQIHIDRDAIKKLEMEASQQ